MKKKITVLAIDEQISLFFKQEINQIFSGILEVDYRHPDMEPIQPIYDTDLILYTDPEILNQLIYIIKCDAPTLMMKRTITREALKKIREIPPGKRALVANINQYMANETMALIYQLGITDIQLYPYYQGKQDLPDEIEYIIVPEQETYEFLPEIEAELILIGNRVFDISNVLDIFSILRIDNNKSEEIIKKYLLQVPTFWYGFEYAWENRRVLLTQWKLMLDEFSSGVVVTDAQDQVELVNNRALKILHLREEELNGERLDQLVEQEQGLKFILSTEEKRDELVRYQGSDLVVTIKPVEFDGNYYGKIIIVNPYSEMVRVQQKIHKKIVGKGYYSRYKFKDLVGSDPTFIRAKEIGRKIARSDSTVLLLGESGTGKEMFAGALHNHSPRADKPFVAINCATLPENLLESELFGYEEGAFTGAKKGGKIGLFERAHQGTLFLDEIGDLPLNLQARLLRALEEKEIMRVGGDSIISVDVRIIAATNRNLLSLVEEGRFREDLFYRLNVFQINIPPLRKRRDDIPLLINYFLERWEKARKNCSDFTNFFTSYHWPGNVRELRNVLEYMTTISESHLCFANLPDYLKQRDYYPVEESELDYLLLQLIYYRCRERKSTGRRSLTELFSKHYFKISEMEARKMIERLAAGREIIIRKGRGGNCITAEGIEALKQKKFIYD